MEKLIELFEEIIEIRDNSRKRHCLTHIIVMAICEILNKCMNGNIPYIVSTYLANVYISIGHVNVDDKSNEITAISELLEILNIEGCIITIDA